MLAEGENNKHTPDWFDRFDRHPRLYSFLLIVLYMFVNNTINASSAWMEATRKSPVEIMLWEPFVWEYTSMLSTAILLPLLFAFWRRYPLMFSAPLKQAAIHVLASLLFALAHVAIMVTLRESVYWFTASDYNFGPWGREFFYEYRKDVWGYVFFLALFSAFRLLYKRLKGEANLINSEESSKTLEKERQSAEYSPPEHLLVRKLDKEFLVKVADIDWLESSGNYVNLHSGGRIYPLRGSLTDLSNKLSHQFTRIHRSRAINHNHVEHISYQPSGDGEVKLLNGETLALSRRYKDELKQKLSI